MTPPPHTHRNIYWNTLSHFCVLCPGVYFPASERKSIKLQQRLLKEAAAFILTHQIPAFVRFLTQLYNSQRHLHKKGSNRASSVFVQLDFCLKSHEAPMDGASLKQALHQRGVSLRYLGHLFKAVSQSEHEKRLRHIKVCLTAEQHHTQTCLSNVMISVMCFYPSQTETSRG